MVVAPLDPLEGKRYVEKINNEGKYGYIDLIYNRNSTIDDYVNMNADKKLS